MSETWQIIWWAIGVLIGILFLIGCVLFVAKPWPAKKPKGSDVVWHQLPAIRGDGSLPCCGRYPNQVPGHDMMTPNPQQVTCGQIPTGRPRRAA